MTAEDEFNLPFSNCRKRLVMNVDARAQEYNPVSQVDL